MQFKRSVWMFMAIGIVTLVIVNQMFLAPRAQSRAMREVFDSVMAGKLKPDSKGDIVLPSSLAGTSIDGHAYVTRTKNLTMVFFPSWHGKGSNVQGTLICSTPLNPNQQSVEIIYSHPLLNSYGLGKNQVPIEEKLADDTYFLYYEMD